jgi:hypothetical protein
MMTKPMEKRKTMNKMQIKKLDNHLQMMEEVI